MAKETSGHIPEKGYDIRGDLTVSESQEIARAEKFYRDVARNPGYIEKMQEEYGDSITKDEIVKMLEELADMESNLALEQLKESYGYVSIAEFPNSYKKSEREKDWGEEAPYFYLTDEAAADEEKRKEIIEKKIAKISKVAELASENGCPGCRGNEARDYFKIKYLQRRTEEIVAQKRKSQREKEINRIKPDNECTPEELAQRQKKRKSGERIT